MRITESRLRSIIRSVIKESWRERSKIDSIRHGASSLKEQQSSSNPEVEKNPEVENVISEFKNHPRRWEHWGNRQRFYMAVLEHGPNWLLEKEQYPRLEKKDFLKVIEAIDGEFDHDFSAKILKLKSYSGYQDDPNATDACLPVEDKR